MNDRTKTGLEILLVAAILGVCGCSGTQVLEFPIANTDLQLKVIKTHAHPFLAEYDFKFVLNFKEKEIDAINMTGDSGGYSRIDVLKTEDGLAFRDHGKSVCLDFGRRTFKDCAENSTTLNLGHFDFDEKRDWRFIPNT